MSDFRQRNSLRHSGYSYTRAGAYHVRLCAKRKLPVFGQVEDAVMILNPLRWHENRFYRGQQGTRHGELCRLR